MSEKKPTASVRRPLPETRERLHTPETFCASIEVSADA